MRIPSERITFRTIGVTNLFLAQSEKDNARRSRIQTLWDFWSGYYRLRRLTLYDFSRNQPLLPVSGSE